ncbi:MAG: extracellular solute-binding protein [Succinivibrio sp.]
MKRLALNLGIIGTLLYSSAALSTQTLVVWEDERKGHGIEQAIKDFEELNDVKVVLSQSAYVSHISTMQENEKNGLELPDIVMLPADRLGEAAKANLLLPIRYTKEEKDRYLSSALKSFTYKNDIYAVPRSVETLVIYYNQDLLKYPFEYMEDYYNFAKEIRASGKWGIISKWDTIYYAYGFLRGFGGYCFGQNSDESLNPADIGLDNAGSIAGAEYLKKFVNGLVPESILGDNGYAEIDRMFIEGEVACVITGPWALDDYAKSGINYGVAPLPKLPNGQYIHPFLGFRGYAVTKYTKNRDLAEKFLSFINQDQYALKRYETIHEIPPVQSVMRNPLIINDDFANAISVQAHFAEPTPSIPEMAQIWEPMNEAMSLALKKEYKAEKVLKEGSDKAREAILSEK